MKIEIMVYLRNKISLIFGKLILIKFDKQRDESLAYTLDSYLRFWYYYLKYFAVQCYSCLKNFKYYAVMIVISIAFYYSINCFKYWVSQNQRSFFQTFTSIIE